MCIFLLQFTLQFPESEIQSEIPGDTVVETVAQATGALGIGMIGMISMMPNIDFQQGGQAPGGNQIYLVTFMCPTVHQGLFKSLGP